MRSIHLKHFRCYSDFRLVFKPGINLLVGDNASGKTSLLKACQYVLSAFFAGFSDENTNWISFDTDDFQRLVEEGRVLPTQPLQIIFDATDLDDTGKKNLSSQVLERRKPKGARILRTGIRLYARYSEMLQLTFYSFEERRQVRPLPLFAYYSVYYSIEGIRTKRSAYTRALRSVTTKHSLGYYGCL
ncbi:MAG: AAA family ATPase, partial [Porphyromonas sp.]|nr:AAA family ATPase [Porphyromonas sp.]